MQTPEDRFYNPARINGWFAISSVLVAVATVAMVLADHYDREWKTYQQGFHDMEKKNAQALLDLRDRGDGAFSAEAREVANLLLRGDRAAATGPSSLDDATFRAKIVEAQCADFPAGAVLAARAYEAEAAALEGSEDLEAQRRALEAKRDEAEANRYKAEKDQREAQGLVDELKFRMDHAYSHAHAEEARAAEKEWSAAVAREKEIHAQMDAFAQEKLDILGEMKRLMTPIATGRNRARTLFEAAGVSGAEKKLDSFVLEGFRETPLLDFPAPVKKIEQRVFPELTEDYNFAQIGRVDRCMTCHTGIDKVRVDPETGAVTPVYTAENTPERVYRTHPRPELYVSSVSKHSLDKVGCTVCHGGLGWGLTFNDSYHTPSTKEQEADWEQKYHWHKGESWDFPMLPMKHIEASCFKCHRDQAQLPNEDKFAKEIPSAPTWNRGLKIVERSGCFGCHKIDGFSVPGLDRWLDEIEDPERKAAARVITVRKTGPSLEKVASKWTSKERAVQWIWSPRGFRPSTNMPHFFGQPNNSGSDPITKSDYEARTRAEAWGLVELLWSRSAKFDAGKAPVSGDAARGKDLFGSATGIGCVACHSTKDWPNPSDGPVNDFGPELSSVGSKTTAAWLYDWIRNPAHYWPGSRMPSLRATEQEAADIAAYLASLRDEAWEKDAPPKPQEAVVRDLAIEAVRATAKAKDDPVAIVEAMAPGKRLETVGEAALKKYACFGCHDVQGFATAERIGTELGGGEAWGSKDVDRLDFGLLEDRKAVETYKSWGAVHLPKRKSEWARTKLLNPRVFDAGITKQPHEKLLMPNFGFTPEEADAVVTFLLSLQKGEVPATKRPVRDSNAIQAEKMKWLARQYNCYGCHHVTSEDRLEDGEWILRSKGRDIEPWLDQSDDKFLPPPLGGQVVKNDRPTPKDPKKRHEVMGEGARVQPKWLFGFLRDPGRQVLRPWIPTRMPTFPFTQQELNALVHGFAAKDGVPFPFEAEQAKVLSGKDLEEAKEYFQVLECAKCHTIGGQATESPSGFAPDLAFTHDRLRYDWVRKWMDKPLNIIPRTAMPARWRSGADDRVLTPPDLGDNKKVYFGNDPQKQIDRIADYVFWLGAPREGEARK